MPAWVGVQGNGRNLVGMRLITLVFWLMQVDWSMAPDGGAAEAAPKSTCGVVFSSCDELMVDDYLRGSDACARLLSSVQKDENSHDCLDIDALVVNCLISWRGRSCRVLFSVSETYSSVSTHRYLHGKKKVAMIDRTARTVGTLVGQPSALPNGKEKFVQQAAHRYHSDADVKFHAILAGISLLACAFVCPCLKPKRKDVAKEFEKDRAMASMSTSLEVSSASEPSPGLAPDAVISVLPKIPQKMTFTMVDIARITNNFSASNIIGHGGFGTVYRGKLSDGTFLAIKRGKKGDLNPYALKEFRNEVMVLSNIEHLNLVKLIGYLEDAQERILIVEYVSNGNLREHLDGKHGITLDLSTRLEIAIDVAHALTYLHLYAEKPIIHRDIKSSNILLTEKFRAKVADFGLSMTGSIEAGKTHVSTKVRGTAGYVDPEYVQTLKITIKSDVYSYGVLLIEIFSGRHPFEPHRPSNERISIRWAGDLSYAGNASGVLDPKLELTMAASVTIKRVVELALDCVAPISKKRPTMKDVTAALWDVRKEFYNLSQVSTPRGASIELSPR